MVINGSYICGGHRIIYRVVKSLRCTLEIDSTLCVNCMSIKKEEFYGRVDKAKSSIKWTKGRFFLKRFPNRYKRREKSTNRNEKEQNVWLMRNNIKQYNIYVIGLPKKKMKERKGQTNY